MREFAGWAPVWLPLVLVAQIGVRGLRPALAEERRLERAEKVQGERFERASERRDELQRLLRAQEDPVFQERQRRSWFAPAENDSEAPEETPEATPEVTRNER